MFLLRGLPFFVDLPLIFFILDSCACTSFPRLRLAELHGGIRARFKRVSKTYANDGRCPLTRHCFMDQVHCDPRAHVIKAWLPTTVQYRCSYSLFSCKLHFSLPSHSAHASYAYQRVQAAASLEGKQPPLDNIIINIISTSKLIN